MCVLVHDVFAFIRGRKCGIVIVLIAYHACNMFPVALVCILFLSCTDCKKISL